MDKQILDKLQQITLFKCFGDDEERLENIHKYMKLERFSKGDSIIQEGQIGDKLYILKSGTVRILRRTLTKEQYTVVVLSSDDNIFFGEVALIDSDKRSATVQAETNCEVLSIERNKYIQFCEEDPQMGYQVTLSIAKRISASLRKMNTDVITLFEALVTEVQGDF
jgi:CRP/FNR family cyclic AMP-dependent transcriptional regulator